MVPRLRQSHTGSSPQSRGPVQIMPNSLVAEPAQIGYPQGYPLSYPQKSEVNFQKGLSARCAFRSRSVCPATSATGALALS